MTRNDLMTPGRCRRCHNTPDLINNFYDSDRMRSADGGDGLPKYRWCTSGGCNTGWAGYRRGQPPPRVLGLPSAALNLRLNDIRMPYSLITPSFK